jgi:hypothetical protein
MRPTELSMTVGLADSTTISTESSARGLRHVWTTRQFAGINAPMLESSDIVAAVSKHSCHG